MNTDLLLYFNIGNAWSNLNGFYNEQFTLSSSIWNKYIFETYDLKTGEDHTECGLRCEFSGSHCDFFTVASNKCYLGRYSHWDAGTVSDTTVPTTYHKSGTYCGFTISLQKYYLQNLLMIT